MTERPQGELYPSAVQRAYKLHNEYLDAVDDWRTLRDENARSLVIWSSIYWALQNDDRLGLNVDQLRSAIDLPGEGWGETPFEMLGMAENTPVSEFLEGELPATEAYEVLKSGEGLPKFVTDGRQFTDKRREIERRARRLHNYLFYGDATAGPDSVDEGDLSEFQEAFGRLSYIQQVTIAKKLTGTLGISEFGRHILANLMDPYYSETEKPRTFRALYLFNPTTVWNDTGTEYLVNPPPKDEVVNGQSILGMDDDGQPYVKDLKLANSLTLLAGRVMPGLPLWQAQQGGNLFGGNFQLAMTVSMLDGGIESTPWKQFKLGNSPDNVKKAFESLGSVLSTGADILEQFENDSRERYQVNSFESAGRDAKIRQYRLYAGNFAGLMTTVASAWGAIAKANEDELDFTLQGGYNALGGIIDMTDLYSGFRDIAGANYDTVKLRDGDMIKYSSSADDAASSVGKTILDWAGKTMSVVDAIISAETFYSSIQNQEYDVAAFAGIGLGLAVVGMFVGGWPAVILGVATLVVNSFMSWVKDDDLTAWARRTEYGDTDVTASENGNPGSKWFGYNGYNRVRAVSGTRYQSGMNRKVSGFYSVLMPFSRSQPISIRDDGQQYSCSFTLKELSMAGVGSGFLLQPIYYTNGEYRVGKIAHDITAIQRLDDFEQYQYTGNDSTSGGLDLVVEPRFEGGAASVSDATKSMEQVQITLKGADSVSDFFGIDRSTIDPPNPAYLETIHVPANVRSTARAELTQALGEQPSEEFLDAVMDHQPYPRQRNKLEVV